MPRFIRSTALALVLLAAGPAWAQVYKWVDDKGVVNYSSQPPADRKSVLLDPNSVSVSTYTPEERPTRPAEAIASAKERMLAERIASLERRLEAEHHYRQGFADAQAAALERRYEPTVVVLRQPLRIRPFVPARSVAALKSSRPMFAPTRTSRRHSPTTPMM